MQFPNLIALLPSLVKGRCFCASHSGTSTCVAKQETTCTLVLKTMSCLVLGGLVSGISVFWFGLLCEVLMPAWGREQECTSGGSREIVPLLYGVAGTLCWLQHCKTSKVYTADLWATVQACSIELSSSIFVFTISCSWIILFWSYINIWAFRKQSISKLSPVF